MTVRNPQRVILWFAMLRARSAGETPCLFFLARSAPACSRKSMTANRPREKDTARDKGVLPRSFSTSTLLPCEMSLAAVSSKYSRAAKCSY